MGYHRAGFTDIVGVDTAPQPRYPFEFIQADALEYAAEYGHRFDVIHASPPCQAWTQINHVWKRDYPELIEPTRELLTAIRKPYVVENVVGAPLHDALMLCGTMFGLDVIRHRLFETWPRMPYFGHPQCQHRKRVVKHGRRPNRERHYAGVTGHFSDVGFAQQATGVDWMTRDELAQAIPPAYTEYIGNQILEIMTAHEFYTGV